MLQRLMRIFWEMLPIAERAEALPPSRFAVLRGGFACPANYALTPGQPNPADPVHLVPPWLRTRGAGILTGFPSATPFGLTLGID